MSSFEGMALLSILKFKHGRWTEKFDQPSFQVQLFGKGKYDPANVCKCLVHNVFCSSWPLFSHLCSHWSHLGFIEDKLDGTQSDRRGRSGHRWNWCDWFSESRLPQPMDKKKKVGVWLGYLRNVLEHLHLFHETRAHLCCCVSRLTQSWRRVRMKTRKGVVPQRTTPSFLTFAAVLSGELWSFVICVKWRRRKLGRLLPRWPRHLIRRFKIGFFFFFFFYRWPFNRRAWFWSKMLCWLNKKLHCVRQFVERKGPNRYCQFRGLWVINWRCRHGAPPPNSNHL